MRRVLLILVICVLGAASPPQPSDFYIVSVFFSDYGPAFYYRVLEVKRDGADSAVRYIRIAPVNFYCPHEMVQAAEARVYGKSPAQLVRNNNPCAIKPEALEATQRRYALKLLKPRFRIDSAAFNNGTHCAERKNATTMKGHDYLFSCNRVAPFLMASCSACQIESGSAKNSNYLFSSEARRSALTQPLPLQAWRYRVTQSRKVPDIAEWPPQYSRALRLPFRLPTYNREALDKLLSSSRRPDRTQESHETSQPLVYRARYGQSYDVKLAFQRLVERWNCSADSTVMA